MSTRRELANAIRALSMDAVQRANSGHPGMPMGMADIAQVLWTDYLRYNPGNPLWEDRDRFVLSNGHGSMLLYSVLYLTGYPLTIADLEGFRQLGSRTPGHPEHDPGLGIETTTGPLGQGIANAVGMALAEKLLAAEFNREGFNIVDHYTYCFCGDGCLMEGVSHEACSLAGTLGLGKLIMFYDDNGISIDGKVAGWFHDNTPERFAAYGWHVIPDVDGLDGEAAKARKVLNWPYPPFVVPDEIRAAWDHRQQGAALEANWRALFARYTSAFPDLAREFERRMRGDLPASWPDTAAQVQRELLKQSAPQATRASSQAALNIIGPALPEIFAGSADLTPSNNTMFKGAVTLTPGAAEGNYLHYGVREFGMTAIMNGITLHGGHLPYGGTFLVFSDYARNAVRLACLMNAHVILVYTHDSIGLGEDGPTHQPIEQLGSLRAIPHMELWRPCDAAETAVAWTRAIARRGATALVFTRQAVPQQPRTPQQLESIGRGGYVLIDCAGVPEALVIATGSEVGIAAQAVNSLNGAGRRVRLVSMPSTHVFDDQDDAYREAVVPHAVTRRLAVEAGARQSWWRYVGSGGRVLGIDRFGASGKGAEVLAHFGFTADNVVQQLRGLLED